MYQLKQMVVTDLSGTPFFVASPSDDVLGHQVPEGWLTESNHDVDTDLPHRKGRGRGGRGGEGGEGDCFLLILFGNLLGFPLKPEKVKLFVTWRILTYD